MCDRPDFEGWEEELDEALISLFRQHQGYLKLWVTDEEYTKMEYSERIDNFIEDCARRLEDLKFQVEEKK